MHDPRNVLNVPIEQHTNDIQSILSSHYRIGYIRKVEKRSELLFSNRPDQFEIRVLASLDTAGQKGLSLFVSRHEDNFQEVLQKTSTHAFRVIAFSQEYSLDPLQCTRRAMIRAIEECKVTNIFFDVLLKFGDQEQVFEESSGFRQAHQSSDGSFELCYQLMYVEPSGRRAPKDPWTFRQTGVYHRYDSRSDRHTCLFLNPKERSESEKILESFVESPSKERSLTNNAVGLHLIFLSCYNMHWQDYIEHLAKSLADIRKYILVADTNSSQFKPGSLQTLRHLEDKVACKVLRCLRSILSLAASIKDVNDKLRGLGQDPGSSDAANQELQLIIHRLGGHINTAELLCERVRSTIGLLENILNLQNQAASDRISTHILHLTRESVDDNATVRVITICTLIYLPASFMATLLGMNLFEFSSESGKLRISPWFWIYVAAVVPLTILTVGSWYVIKLRNDKKRKKANVWPV